MQTSSAMWNLLLGKQNIYLFSIVSDTVDENFSNFYSFATSSQCIFHAFSTVNDRQEILVSRTIPVLRQNNPSIMFGKLQSVSRLITVSHCKITTCLSIHS